jgi:TPR repeat protein
MGEGGRVVGMRSFWVAGLFVLAAGGVWAEEKGKEDTYTQANRLFYGLGCMIDEKNAVALYRQAVEEGDVRALAWKARQVTFGRYGFAKNDAEARRILEEIEPKLRKMISEGYFDAKQSLCRLILTVAADKREEAYDLSKSLAEEGDVTGFRGMAYCFQFGIGVKKDETKKFMWCAKAAEQGCAISQFNLGLCYEKGMGIAKDEKKAFAWYSKSALKNYANAQAKVAFCYEKGIGIDIDARKAVESYLEMVKQFNVDALYILGKKLKSREIGQFEANPADRYFKELSGLELREKGSAENYLIGIGGLETGNFLKAKQALLMAGNRYGPTAQNIQPESMRLTRPEDLWENYVLQILDKDKNPIGTGVFCSQNGWVLTAAHVVAGQETITVRDAQMNLWPVEGLFPGEFSADLVLMKTSAKPEAFAELADSGPKAADLVIQVGHPWGVLRQIVSDGKLENLHGDGGTWVCSLSSMPGNSGSPVFNEDKELIGISSQATYVIQPKAVVDNSRTWVVPLHELKKMIRSAKDGASFSDYVATKEWEGRSRFWNAAEGKKASSLLMGQTLLSESYEERDPQKAAAIFLTEAEKGDAQGIYLLADMHYRGEGVLKDQEKALEMWKESADQGNAQAMFRLGAEADRGGVVPQNRTEALKWYQKAAEKGDAAAMANTGVYYLNGWGTQRDFQQAEKWIRASAEKGNAFGQYVYGVMWEGGYGVRINPALAAKWFEQAAKGGNLDAMVKYAQCLEFGSGANLNQVGAIVWYQRAASGNNADAIFRLGAAYANGRGVPKDFSQALKLWEKSAKMGHKESIQKLASFGREVCQ